MNDIKSEVLITPIGEMIYEDGILCINIIDGGNVSYENTITNWLLTKEYLQDKKVPVLVDIRNSITASRDTLRFGASAENNQNRSAIAYVLKEEDFSKEVFEAYKRNYAVPIPSEVFFSKGEALQWLKQFVR